MALVVRSSQWTVAIINIPLQIIAWVYGAYRWAPHARFCLLAHSVIVQSGVNDLVMQRDPITPNSGHSPDTHYSENWLSSRCFLCLQNLCNLGALHQLQIARVLLQGCLLQIPLYDLYSTVSLQFGHIYCNIDIGVNRHCNIPVISAQYARIARENGKLQKLFT